MKGHLAWPTLPDPVPLEVRLAVDGEAVAAGVHEAERHHLALHQQVGPGWEVSTVQLTTRLPDDLPDRLQRPLDDIATTATLSCRSTNLRIGVPLVAVDGEPGTRRGHVDLWRDEVHGRVDLAVDLTIAEGASADRLLGGSRPWTIAVDEPARGPGSSRSPFRVEWEDFRSPKHAPPLAGLGDVPSYLDLGGGEPILYLNTAVSNLQQLLTWDTARTGARDVRDLVAGSIAADALQVIASEALEQVVVLDSGPEPPGIAVLDNALELLADQLPSVSSLDELLERVAHDRAQGTGDVLRSEVAAVVARLCGMSDTVARAADRATGG